MNIAFSKMIRIGERLWEFNFRKLPGENFHGDVTDQKGKRISFVVHRRDDRWSITGDDLPLWIIGGEAIITASLEEGLLDYTSTRRGPAAP
jgi:hypothetical protein